MWHGQTEIANEFFELYFGKAAAEMKKFYTAIKNRYTNPESYPDNVQQQDRQFHQTEEQAWKYLGTEEILTELES